MFTFRNVVHWITMALLGALVGGILTLVAMTGRADAASGEQSLFDYPPDTASITKAEGTRIRGFKYYRSDGTSSFIFKQPRILRDCDRVYATDARRAVCRERWRGFYYALVDIRNSAETPDYWPFPDEDWPFPPYVTP